MSKAVLISIQPQWCDRIASGIKTVEVRKTRPKLEPPFKCYIYCTKFKYGELLCFPQWKTGKVIGEFVCDSFFPYCQAKPIGNAEDIEQQSRLTRKEIWEYAPSGNPIGWHISDLVIYDRPKELGKFKQCHICEYMGVCNDQCWKPLMRPPQSWCYVEELPEGGTDNA